MATYKEVVNFINTHHWTFAKTYAAFCPHEYVAEEWLKTKAEKDFFWEFGNFIQEKGKTATYGRLKPNQYLRVGEWYYWQLGNIINRARVDYYLCYEDLLGEIHMRRRKKGESTTIDADLWKRFEYSE